MTRRLGRTVRIDLHCSPAPIPDHHRRLGDRYLCHCAHICIVLTGETRAYWPNYMSWNLPSGIATLEVRGVTPNFRPGARGRRSNSVRPLDGAKIRSNSFAGRSLSRAGLHSTVNS